MNILIIGLGGIGQRYLRLLKTNFKKSNIYALRKNKKQFEIKDNLKIDRKINIIKKYDISVIKNIKDIKNVKLDFALITSPTSLHLKYCKELISSEIPILIEKPLSNSYLQAKKILDYNETKKNIFLTAHVFRFYPSVLKLKKLLDSNYIGNIYCISINIFSFMPNWHQYEDYKKLYASRRDLGGGVLLTESHEIDLLVWLFGMPNKLFSINSKTSKFNIDVEDTAVSIFLYKNSKQNFLVNINQCFTSKAQKRSISILGEKGSLELDLMENNIIFDNYKIKKKLFSMHSFDRNSVFLNLLNYFIKRIDNKIKYRETILDSGLNTLKLIDLLKSNKKP